MDVYSVDRLIEQTRKLAAEYRMATGQVLPVSSEIANFDASRLLGLRLIQPAPGGYDAVGEGAPFTGKRIQIKGRVVFGDQKSTQRIGQMKLEQEWDTLLLVIMDEHYDTLEIYAADREVLEAALDEGGARRNKRGAMTVAKFKYLSRLVWARDEGVIADEIWDNYRDA